MLTKMHTRAIIVPVGNLKFVDGNKAAGRNGTESPGPVRPGTEDERISSLRSRLSTGRCTAFSRRISGYGDLMGRKHTACRQ